MKQKKQIFEGKVVRIYMVSFRDYFVGKDGPTYSCALYSQHEKALDSAKEYVIAGHEEVEVKTISTARLASTTLSVIDNNCGYHLRPYTDRKGHKKFGITNK